MAIETGDLPIVNDRPHLAIEATANEARRIVGPDRILGLSTHNRAQPIAAQSGPANYVGFGPVSAAIAARSISAATRRLARLLVWATGSGESVPIERLLGRAVGGVLVGVRAD